MWQVKQMEEGPEGGRGSRESSGDSFVLYEPSRTEAELPFGLCQRWGPGPGSASRFFYSICLRTQGGACRVANETGRSEWR